MRLIRVSRNAPAVLSFIAKLVVTTGLLAALLSSVDSSRVLGYLQQLPAASVGAAACLAALQIGLVGQRWFIVLRTVTGDTTSIRVVKVHEVKYASQFVGQFLPFLAADALRVMYAEIVGTTMRSALLSAVLDRGVALLVVVAVSSVAALTTPVLASLQTVTSTISTLAVLSTGGDGHDWSLS